MIRAGQQVTLYATGSAIRDSILGAPIPFSAPDDDEIRRYIINGLTPWFRVYGVTVESSTGGMGWRATIALTPLMDMDREAVRTRVMQAAAYDATEVADIVVTFEAEAIPPVPSGPIAAIGETAGGVAGDVLGGALRGLGTTGVIVLAVVVALVLIVAVD